jgi:hypothetical protein
MRRTSCLVATAAALCSLALLASPALAAVAIRLQPSGAITKTVESFTIRAFGGEVRIICRLTLRGRVATIIDKAFAGRLPEGRIGQIEEAATEGCRSNFGGPAELTILVEPGAPIALRYQAFLGALPNIAGLLFRKLAFGFRVEEPFVLGACLYRGMVDLLLTFPPVEGGAGTRFNPEAFVTPNAIPKTGGMLCPEIIEVSGNGRVTPAQRAILLN